MVLYFYAVLSAVIMLFADRVCPIFSGTWAPLTVPLIFVGITAALAVVHILVHVAALLFVNTEKPPRAMRFFRAISKTTMPLICKIMGVKIRLSGEDLLPKDRRIVLVCNHTHVLDPVVLLAALPNAELSFLAKKEVATNMRLIAQFIHSLGGTFVDRQDRRSGAAAIINLIKLIKEDKASVCIFPEGHRTEDGNLQEFKGGAYKIATKTGAPIVVCTVKNVTSIFKNLPFKRTEVSVDVLRVIGENEYKDMTTDEIAELSKKIMQDNLGETV